jgi:hypothetical protein
MNGYLCPVCFYSGFNEPPEEFDICPCCGTEYGIDDFALSPEDTSLLHRQLRWQWVDNGAHWFDPGTPQPDGWNGIDQILRHPFAIRHTSHTVQPFQMSVQYAA